jgi:hypothetical protein
MPWILLCPDPCGGQVVAGGKAPSGGGECQRCGRIFESAESVTAAGGGAAHLCVRGGRRPRCSVPGCDRPQAALCDYPVERKGRKGTCDTSMCATHRTSVGPNRDHCPAHAKATATSHVGGASK